ncbi:MAG: tape measure protein [Bryobacteraceae bacterium]
MPILSNLLVRIGATTDDFDKKVDRAAGKIKRFSADVTAAGETLALGFSAPVIAAGGYALKAATDMEALQKGLSATMKSATLAAEEMGKLKEVAKLPGLGLEEAVRGSIRLQILGNSASESRRIMSELGNALAVVGGGKIEFAEVIRQLSQLGAVGKVTKENLDPIVERIPQIAAIIKEKFGAAALGDPAKTFEKLGISSQQFIKIIVDELAKGERAGGTFKVSWENLREAANQTAADFGKVLLPIAKRVLDEFLVPAVTKAQEYADAFSKLPKPTQDWAVSLTAIATAAPLVIVALGTLAEKGAALVAVANKAWPIIKTLAGNISVVGTASIAAGAAVGYFLNFLNDRRQNTVDTSAEALKRLNEAAGTGSPVAFGKGADAIMGYMRVMAPATEATAAADAAHTSAAAAVDKHAKAYESLKAPSLDMQLLHERMRDVMGEYRQKISAAADVLKVYGAVTIDGAIAAARMADEQFRLNRALDEAPAIPWMNVDFKSIPKAEMPTFPGDFEEYKRSAKNIGDLGMMTKEQYEAMTSAAKRSSKEQSVAMRQVSTVLTDLSRGITDVIFKGGKLKDMFRDVAMQAAQSITRLLIEGALKNLASKLLEVGGLAGKVFGGGTSVAMSAASGGASAAGKAAGGIGGGASAAGSAASTGIMGAIGVVSGVVSAVSGVIGNFQMAGMNKTLDLIEKEVRYSQIHLLNLLEKNNEFLPNLKNIWESLIRMETRQMAVAEAGGGATVTININGGNPQQTLTEITRLLKQYGVIPR